MLSYLFFSKNETSKELSFFIKKSIEKLKKKF